MNLQQEHGIADTGILKAHSKTLATFLTKLSNTMDSVSKSHFLKKWKGCKEKAEVNRETSEYNKYIASLCCARGGLVFVDYGPVAEGKYYSIFGWSTEVEFDQSLLIWHIATKD